MLSNSQVVEDDIYTPQTHGTGSNVIMSIVLWIITIILVGKFIFNLSKLIELDGSSSKDR